MGDRGYFLVLLMFKVATEVAFFDSFALIVFFLAFTSSDDKLNIATASEQTNWNNLKAVLFGACEGIKLTLGDEELEVFGGFGA